MSSNRSGLLAAMYAEQRRIMYKEGRKQRSFLLRKHKEIEEDVKNQNWEDVYQKNLMKLSVMMLLYVFFEDDNELSRFELKRVKKFFRKNTKYLTKSDFKDIERFFETKVKLSDFLDYMDQHGYEISIFNDAVEEVSPVVRYSGKYLLIIHELKKAYNNR